jgi:ABC-type antimicrobial peptide transport system permease subunit
VIGEESLEERRSELERSGEALALRLFVITALVALGLAAGTLLAYSFIMIRRRAYELAAIKALGASHALLVRSGRRELLALVGTGVVLGLVSGLVAASAALPALLGGTGADGPPPWFGPAWLPVLVLAAAVLALLALISDISARSTARRASPDLLRQVQE